MCKDIASKCDICSERKLTNVVKDGKMPLREDKLIKPWDLLSVDLCGLWIVKCEFEEPQQIQEMKIWALTMIDEGLSWPEIAPIENKYAEEMTKLVDNYWFSRYPRPLYYIHDNGGEFIGQGFVELLQSYGVDPKPTTVKNPQSNGLHERKHLVLCEMLRSQKLYVPKESIARREINRVLQSAAWAMRTSIHMITKYSPGQLIFQRNMIIHKRVIADWEWIHSRRRSQQIKDNERENRSRTNYIYKAGDMIRIITTAKDRRGKLIGFEHPGPYAVTQAHNNGTITIRYGNFLERIKIRRVKIVNNK